MNDILRTFRLGTINLLGITIPGLVFLFLLFFGCIAPCLFTVSRWLHVSVSLNTLPPIGRLEPSFIAAIVLIIAYVAGYIFRLSTPDDLDKKSADIVLKRMKAKKGEKAPEDDHWPYRGEPDNKYPYFHFREYLISRKHPELAKEVQWDAKVRSKTFVSKMKFETALRSQQLSGIIDSNEAHIRLMFGTWLACIFTLPLIVLGFIMSGAGIVVAVLQTDAVFTSTDPQATFLLWPAITGLLLIGNIGAKWRIENLFHYRRVRELFDIVACYQLATDAFDAGGRPRAPVENHMTLMDENRLKK